MSLEGQIHKLSAKAIVSENPEELHGVMAELRSALREHHLRAKNLVARQFFSERTDWQDFETGNQPDAEHHGKKKKAKEKEGKIYFFFFSGRP